jgi:hypothetical protein
LKKDEGMHFAINVQSPPPGISLFVISEECDENTLEVGTPFIPE